MNTVRRHSRGFSLMELLVAMTVFSIVMTGVYAAFRDAARLWRDNEADADVFQQARVAVSIMERDLRSMSESSAFFFKGDSAGRAGRHDDEMEFYTVVPPMVGRERRVPRLVRVAYYLRRERFRGNVLRRREQLVEGPLPRKRDFARAGGTPTDFAVDLGRSDYIELAENIESMRFRYYWPNLEVGEKWRSECQPGEGPPPCVQIELIFTDPHIRGGRKKFLTGVPIPVEKGPGPRIDMIL